MQQLPHIGAFGALSFGADILGAFILRSGLITGAASLGLQQFKLGPQQAKAPHPPHMAPQQFALGILGPSSFGADILGAFNFGAFTLGGLKDGAFGLQHPKHPGF